MLRHINAVKLNLVRIEGLFWRFDGNHLGRSVRVSLGNGFIGRFIHRFIDGLLGSRLGGLLLCRGLFVFLSRALGIFFVVLGLGFLFIFVFLVVY